VCSAGVLHAALFPLEPRPSLAGAVRQAPILRYVERLNVRCSRPWLAAFDEDLLATYADSTFHMVQRRPAGSESVARARHRAH
jgi:hypothetical protein